ncbi:MAG: ABC transporter ATP-binding protein [Cellulomonadaceae bacterium]|nr:ABC transporter ATP-binding protein [Cellulomonadaceae bacterium]
MTAAPTSAVRARGLSVVRGGKDILHGVDLDIPAGHVTGLLGPSGSGKTTLMRAMVGVQDNVTGELTVLGEPAGAAALRRRVGYDTQAASVYADLTVRANVEYFASLAGLRGSDAKDAVDAALTSVDLTFHAAQRIASLSGGERSRASLAATFVGNPELIILDEPTVGLDPVLRRALWELFRRLADDGRTLVVSSHVMDEASRCDRLILMRDGRVMASTTPDDLLADTGTTDAESAFLALIDREGSAS